MRTEERTAASASAIIDLDLSFSRLSWAERAISDERRRRFSTLSAEICALSSSIFTLRVEFNLGEDSDQTPWRLERSGGILCDVFVGEEESFLDWVWGSERVVASGRRGLTVLKFEESVVLSYVDRDTRFPPAHRSVLRRARRVAASSLVGGLGLRLRGC